MARRQVHNINLLIGWFCGAVFLAAPVVAFVYLLRHQKRPALQAVLIGVLSFSCIVGARALMLAKGVQRQPREWIVLNALVFTLFPVLATGAAVVIPFAGSRRPGPADKRTARKSSRGHDQ